MEHIGFIFLCTYMNTG